MARLLYLCGAILLCVASTVGTLAVEHLIAPKAIVRGMMDSVRQPSSGQFNEPSDAVSFFLSQIQAQDIDEASRAFPIREEYLRDFFEVYAQYQGFIDPHFDPLSNADFHNAFRAFRQLQDFDKVSLFLLDVDQLGVIASEGKTRPFFSENGLSGLASRLDRNKLHSMRTKSIGLPRLLPRLMDNPRDPAMGITAFCTVDAVVERENKEYALSFELEKIDDQWRIRSIETGEKS